MVLHTFGDSHSSFGFKDIENINIHWVGPLLCYTFGNKKIDALNIKDHGVNDNDTIIFCFGEIDCRAHIYKHVNENKTYQEIIDNIVENYFEAIKENISQYKNIKTVVYNVVPPSDVYLIHTKEEIETKVMIKNTNEIPWKGSNEDRKNYVIYFNLKIKELCIKYNYIFMDIYDKYSDNKGFLIREYSDKNVHITEPFFMKEFLINNNLL